MAKTAKEKQLKNLIDKLSRDVRSLKEQQKVTEKRLEFFQDQSARLAVEMSSLLEAVKFIVETTNKIAQSEQQVKEEASVRKDEGPGYLG